jgi:sulfite exporter TauE/SafE
MSELALPLSLFVAGLASGMHCAGMCGGISTAFAMARNDRILAFNAGRIASYSVAGAAAGTLGAGAYAVSALPLQTVLYVVASLVVVIAGLQLLGIRFLSKLDRFGAPLWRRVQPLAARLVRTNAFGAGLAWGWVPCGLVYAALAAAMFAGGPAEGAIAMAAFGAGTLPWLLAAGVVAARLREYRRLAGAFLIGCGAWGAAHASGLAETVRQSLICL